MRLQTSLIPCCFQVYCPPSPACNASLPAMVPMWKMFDLNEKFFYPICVVISDWCLVYHMQYTCVWHEILFFCIFITHKFWGISIPFQRYLRFSHVLNILRWEKVGAAIQKSFCHYNRNHECHFVAIHRILSDCLQVAIFEMSSRLVK